MALRSAPHTVSVFRRLKTTKSTYGKQLVAHDEVATDIAFDVQLQSGNVEQRGFGGVQQGEYQAFAPTNTDILAGDLIRIDESDVAAMIGRIFDVKSAMDWGARGDMQLVVCDSDARIESSAS